MQLDCLCERICFGERARLDAVPNEEDVLKFVVLARTVLWVGALRATGSQSEATRREHRLGLISGDNTIEAVVRQHIQRRLKHGQKEWRHTHLLLSQV